MEHKTKTVTGRFLTEQDRAALKWERKNRFRQKRRRKILAFLGLIGGNGLLLYMISGSHIHPCYGAGFAAAVSAYLGYRMHS